jgi:hypothetical protein
MHTVEVRFDVAAELGLTDSTTVAVFVHLPTGRAPEAVVVGYPDGGYGLAPAHPRLVQPG